MIDFPLHTTDTAPDASRPVLEGVQNKYGFAPNLFKVFAEAPATIQAYAQLSDAFQKTSLSATEQQVVLLTASLLNECNYCMAAHSTVAKGAGVPDDILTALRDAEPLPDAKLDALRKFTAVIVQKRGWASEEDIDAFVSAGYGKGAILEVITGVALKTISNYTNHIAETPVDDAFAGQTWIAPSKR
ncbi:MAG: carboxymuconolactone decarboxylase family protein [Pseudomonadota bacterium]